MILYFLTSEFVILLTVEVHGNNYFTKYDDCTVANYFLRNIQYMCKKIY